MLRGLRTGHGRKPDRCAKEEQIGRNKEDGNTTSAQAEDSTARCAVSGRVGDKATHRRTLCLRTLAYRHTAPHSPSLVAEAVVAEAVLAVLHSCLRRKNRRRLRLAQTLGRMVGPLQALTKRCRQAIAVFTVTQLPLICKQSRAEQSPQHLATVAPH